MTLPKSTKGDYRKTLMFVKANEANIQTTPELVFFCWSNNPSFSNSGTSVGRNGKDLPCLLRTEGRCQNQRFKASYSTYLPSFPALLPIFFTNYFPPFCVRETEGKSPLNVSRPQGLGTRGKNFCRGRRRRPAA